MDADRATALNRGMQLVPTLPEVMPEQADPFIAAIYDDIRATLRVPFVNFIFRLLANYPAYLALGWGLVGPALRTHTLEQVADDLRAHALLEPLPSTSNIEWPRLGDLAQIRPFTETIAYVLPKLLLVTTAFDEGLRRGVRPGEASPQAEVAMKRGASIPLGVAAGTVSIPMVDPKRATGEVKNTFDAIQQRHRHPGVATYFRALGHWPDFLRVIWQRLELVVGSDAYEARKQELVNHAGKTVHELLLPTGPAATALGVTDEQLAEIRGVLTVFRFRLIPDLLLDVSLIRGMLEGSAAAQSSRFSVRG